MQDAPHEVRTHSFMPRSAQSDKRNDGMVKTPRIPLGLRLSGKFGPLEVYTNRRGKHVWYEEPKLIPTPSEAQKACRERFKQAVFAWKNLASEEKKALEEAVKRASIALTGQNIWISAYTSKGRQALEALSRQTGIPLPLPP